MLNAILAQRYKADKSILEELVGQAEDMNLTGYTAECVATFRTALAQAQAVLADETLTEDDQKTVDAAVEQLTQAMNGLTAEGTDKPQTTDKPETSQKPDAMGKPQATQQPDTVPPTGDASQLMVYVAAMGAAALLMGAAVVARKRRG